MLHAKKNNNSWATAQRKSESTDLVGLGAGEEAGEGAAAGRQGGGERGATVSQDGLQVTVEGPQVKDVITQWHKTERSNTETSKWWLSGINRSAWVLLAAKSDFKHK